MRVNSLQLLSCSTQVSPSKNKNIRLFFSYIQVPRCLPRPRGSILQILFLTFYSTTVSKSLLAFIWSKWSICFFIYFGLLREFATIITALAPSPTPPSTTIFWFGHPWHGLGAHLLPLSIYPVWNPTIETWSFFCLTTSESLIEPFIFSDKASDKASDRAVLLHL